ncbi:MAG: 16S rRNA (cytosine(1402)-N(4))-methyltransferase RsmH [Patescibacteria group bacterium]
MKNETYHEPVLVDEVLSHLAPLKKARIVDSTLGTGGHTLEMVKKGAVVLGIDADAKMLEVARKRLEEASGSFRLIHDNFRNIDGIAKNADFKDVDGVLFDLGVSNIHLTSDNRGFSFSNPEAELDMRLDSKTQGLKASDLLNSLREDHLIALFGKVLKFSEARYLAKRVVQEREKKHIQTVGDFLRVVMGLTTKKSLHPATLPFLALRFPVNSELENLNEGLPKAFSLLKKGGKLLLITFHSGEEKVVLDFYHEAERRGEAKILTRRPVRPGEGEIRKNPRARSAELYVLAKT